MDDARRVAAKIGIPFYVLDFEALFEAAVINPFCREYREGRTPNPCVVCNHAVKFGYLLERARALGADAVATGHYAWVHRDQATGRFVLMRGTDRRHDQSYFLYGLSQEQLSRAVFPLGEMTKEETRGRARAFGLKVFDKRASQDICFVAGGDYRRFLAERSPASLRPGPIVNRRGDVLGQHRGVACYTIGQRRGLGVAVGRPLYVVDLDAATRTVVVGTRQEVLRRRLTVAHVNWIAFERPRGQLKLAVKARHRQAEAPALVTCRENGRADVSFISPQTAPAAGQSAVFYDGDVVVGGGIIEAER
jgi:tRNA-specific 2-thiouridylase